MKIRGHHYTLQPGNDPARAARSPRHGALLKIEFDDHATGHADLHPWPEFGHPPLQDHLASLAQNNPTPLAALAMAHARADADARRAGVSLFNGLPEVQSHALFTDWTKARPGTFEQCAAEGYKSAKLKIGGDPSREAAALNALDSLPLHWRLDANAAFPSGESIKTFLSRLNPNIRRNIEFLEDPCPHTPTARAALPDSLPLALDWQTPSSQPPWPGAQILVIKPATQNALPLASLAVHAGMNIVITHGMDHPLGQSTALWTAMRLRQKYGDIVLDGGLQAVGLYAPDAFTKQIQTNGPHITPPPGTGFGFDHLLAALPWSPVS